LKGDTKVLMYIEWTEGMVELGFISEVEVLEHMKNQGKEEDRFAIRELSQLKKDHKVAPRNKSREENVCRQQ